MYQRQNRTLTREEISALEQQGCRCSDWSKILVGGRFDSSVIRFVDFSGSIELYDIDGRTWTVGNLEVKSSLEYAALHNVCIGSGSSVRHVDHLVNTDVGEHCLLERIHEISGNGFRPCFEISYGNENGKRRSPIYPGFTEQLVPFLESLANREDFKQTVPFYHRNLIGNGSRLSDCGIIRNLICGKDSLIIGLRYAEDLFLEEASENPAVIMGAEVLERGILSAGCLIGARVIARDFFLGQYSRLMDSARLNQVILGANSTIAGAEVQYALIQAFHEQHHSNSFLIAAVLEGQSNMAAGSTIGSNHNSRRNEGEIYAKRGFWPGLCVSLKHFSFFASYSLIAKGDYPCEINNPFPFSLLSRDETNGQLVIYPAFWFIHNAYALERNWMKFRDRDKRSARPPHTCYHYLGPDTVTEMWKAVALLEGSPAGTRDELFLGNLEEGNREVLVRKPKLACVIYRRMILLYCLKTLKDADCDAYRIECPELIEWKTLGGVPFSIEGRNELLAKLKKNPPTNAAKLLEVYHLFLVHEKDRETQYARKLFWILRGKDFPDLSFEERKLLINEVDLILDDHIANIKTSREKDFSDPIRNLFYDTPDQKEAVLGTLESDTFLYEAMKNVLEEKEQMKTFLLSGKKFSS